MAKIDDFKKELAELIIKYNATIGVEIHGDSHGVDTELYVEFGKIDGWKEYSLGHGGIDKIDVTPWTT
jgi:hypothetical protein